MTSTHEGDIHLPGLPPEAAKAHLFKELAQGSGSLVSLGQLCDHGCTATFDATTVKVYHKQQCIITGHRTAHTGLWHIPISPPPGFPTAYPTQQPPLPETPQTANAILPRRQTANGAHFDPTKAQQVAYSHSTLGSPVLDTLQHALDNLWITGFPGLNSKSLRRHPPQSKATTKGHMDQIRKGTKSTKQKQAQEPPQEPTCESPAPLPKGQRTHSCYATMLATLD